MFNGAVRIDVFCRVVDNYGDAGITWRLSRQLAAEHGGSVTLWIDAPHALACLAPGLDHGSDVVHQGVRVRHLRDDSTFDFAPQVVVEGFGCGLPEPYLHGMAGARAKPLWINLEYLSAEPWIETVHTLPSPHPRLPLVRYFFFPGFTRATGGLLREGDLMFRRDDAHAACGREALHDTGNAAASGTRLVVSLFCYANPALPGLLDAWCEGEEPMLCVVPEGVATASFDAWLAGAVPHAGERFTRGALTLASIPFLGQDDYDHLLWGCDVNFVRGEDSFVRAQWAARPFAWHIYPQADDAHRVKLEAFLDRYLADTTDENAQAVRAFWRSWNEGDPAGAAAAWPAFRARTAGIERHNDAWARHLAALPDLASSLMEFCRNRL
jgi:uncharacterized repeat protein (TIGR03837 family)